MKKFLAVAMSVTMVFGVAACSSSDKTTDTKNEETTTEGEATDAEGGVLKMGTSADFPPFESYDDDGKTIVGYDVDMMTEICNRIGMTLEITDMNFDSVVTAVQTGKIDMVMAGMTVTPDREKNVSFSLIHTM